MSAAPPTTDAAATNVEALRDELFATLRALRAGTLEVDRAKAISDVAQTIINSAKVEVEHQRVAGWQPGATESGFFGKAKTLPPGILGSTTHRIKG